MPVSALEAGLHIVATPIGNLEDMTLRGLKALAAADLIACEDTRVTAKLLQRYGIRRPLLPYHEHNARAQGATLLARLDAGEAVALVSDAGTPLISDPGALLVTQALASGHRVVPYPGASALLAALAVAGLPAGRFHFVGFLPPKVKARRKALAELASVPDTLVFYETAPRLAASLADMSTVLGERPCALCRELTKLHETVLRGTLPSLAQGLQDKTLKGEIVLVVGAGAREDRKSADVEALLAAALKTSSMKDAVAHVTASTRLPRREIYAAALKLQEKS